MVTEPTSIPQRTGASDDEVEFGLYANHRGWTRAYRGCHRLLGLRFLCHIDESYYSAPSSLLGLPDITR